jgi:hypothetical protein
VLERHRHHQELVARWKDEIRIESCRKKVLHRFDVVLLYGKGKRVESLFRHGLRVGADLDEALHHV